MKTYIVWCMLLWFALIVENSRPDMFPSCSLTLPLAVGCIFWLRNGTAIVIAGMTLIFRWLLHPSLLPIEVASMLICAAFFLTQQKASRSRSPIPSHSSQFRAWIPLALVTLIALSTHAFVEADMQPITALAHLGRQLTVATPCTIVIVFAFKIADEFGLRRYSQLA